MNKLFVLVLLLLSISSSVFADCNLDESRWKWLFSTDNYGCYYDRNTAKIKSTSTFEAWICDYFPGHASCRFSSCINAGKDTSEHYHYTKSEYNSDRYTVLYKIMICRDKYGGVIDSIEGSPYDKPYPVIPDSIGEDIMLKIKQDLYKYRRY